ncbi:MAG: VOC family protein [Deinococcales bacterium]
MPDPADPTATLPPDSRIGRVTLAVNDLPALTSFYRAALGLTVLGEGEGWVELGTAEAHLVRLETTAEREWHPGSPGLYHLAVVLPGRPALGAWLRTALERGTPLQGAADHAVSEAVYLADPEGNGIEVYRDRPRERWQVRDGTVTMTTEPLDAADLLADAAPSWDSAPAATRIGHVHLQVSDLERSTAFYASLGLSRTNDRVPGACFLAAGGYHHHLGLNTWGVRRHAAPARRSGAPGLRRFEVLVPEGRAAEEAAARLTATGVAVRRRQDGFDATDPDGLGVRVRGPGDGTS